MKKDIFIDNNIASKFCNPLDPEYKKLVKWLITKTEIEEGVVDEQNAHIVYSNKLLTEYIRSAKDARSNTSMPAIIDKMTREGRYIKISNAEIKDFQKEYFTKKVLKNLLSNKEDKEHIPVVMLSERQFVLAYDVNFTHDLENFKGFKGQVEKRPEDLPYSQ